VKRKGVKSAPRQAGAPEAKRTDTGTAPLLPMEIQVGDRFTDQDFEWEVVTHPATLHGGKRLRARIRRPGLPETERDMTWPAHVRVEIRRAHKPTEDPGASAGRPPVPDDRRLATLCASLGFLQLDPRASELRMLHEWPDRWSGIGHIAVGMQRQGYFLSLSHIAEGEWRAVFMGDNPLVAPKGFGVAPQPWRAVQVAAWAAAKSPRDP